MLATLVYTALTNSVDMEGDLPEELTADMTCRIEVEGHDPVVVKDTFSGSSYSGGRAPQALYSPIGSIIQQLTYNTYKPVRINRIECDTRPPARAGISADIEAVELDSDTYAPGETVKATVFLRPYKGQRQRVPVSLKLPADLPEGTYTAPVCDDLTNARLDLRDNPTLYNPQNLEQVFEALKVQTDARADQPGAARAGRRGRAWPWTASRCRTCRRAWSPSWARAAAAAPRRWAAPWSPARPPTGSCRAPRPVKFTVAKNKKTTETP